MFLFEQCKPHPVLSGVLVCPEIEIAECVQREYAQVRNFAPFAGIPFEDRGADTVLALL